MPVCFTPSVIALEAPWALRALVPEEMEGVEMAQVFSEGWACRCISRERFCKG